MKQDEAQPAQAAEQVQAEQVQHVPENADQIRKRVNDLLSQLQATDDPQQARELSAELAEQAGKLPD